MKSSPVMWLSAPDSRSKRGRGGFHLLTINRTFFLWPWLDCGVNDGVAELLSAWTWIKSRVWEDDRICGQTQEHWFCYSFVCCASCFIAVNEQLLQNEWTNGSRSQGNQRGRSARHVLNNLRSWNQSPVCSAAQGVRNKHSEVCTHAQLQLISLRGPEGYYSQCTEGLKRGLVIMLYCSNSNRANSRFKQGCAFSANMLH